MNEGHLRATITLPSERQILIVREFNAPRRLVYRAWTTPELIAQWWGGDRGRVTSVEVDLRVGGAWRYVMVAHNEFEVAFHGTYREIAPEERLVHTQIYDPFPDVVAVVTNTFSEAGTGCVVSILVDHPTPDTRDMQLASGMEEGMQESLSHLERVANSLLET
ncbi:MAG: SRPBCC family protein [Acidimicrobiales bacterium]